MGNLRSSGMINKDFKKIGMLINLKKNSKKDVDTYRAMLNTQKLIKNI